MKSEREVFEKFREVHVTGRTCSVSLTSCFENENLEYLLHKALSTLLAYEDDSLRENCVEMLKKSSEEKKAFD